MRIKDILKEKGLTAKEFAQSNGLYEAVVSKIANGKANPSLQTLEAIANALGVPLWHLFADPAEVIASIGAPIVETVKCPECGAEVKVAISHVKIEAVGIKVE